MFINILCQRYHQCFCSKQTTVSPYQKSFYHASTCFQFLWKGIDVFTSCGTPPVVKRLKLSSLEAQIWNLVKRIRGLPWMCAKFQNFLPYVYVASHRHPSQKKKRIIEKIIRINKKVETQKIQGTRVQMGTEIPLMSNCSKCKVLY